MLPSNVYPSLAREKWDRMVEGEKVIASDFEMESFESWDETGRLVSVRNPRQVGTLDQYVVSLRRI